MSSKKTVSQLITTYLARRATPATTTQIFNGIKNRIAVEPPIGSIRRTLYQMARDGSLQTSAVKVKNSSLKGFKLV